MTRRARKAFKTLTVSAALLLLAALVWQVSRARCFTLVGAVTCRVETSAPMVALTFDDGPSEIGARHAIGMLNRFGAKATFFLTGREAEQRPQLVHSLVAAGHEIGNHSYSHRHMVARAQRFYDEEIARTDAALRRAGVRRPQWFRPPYGKKLIGLPSAVERHGYRMITWDVEDPPGTVTSRAYADRIVRDARPGSIILMHIMYSTNRTARDALPLVLKGLRAKGLEVVTVGRLIEAGRRR